jgi:outer membrane protein assembly factor BamA
MRLQAFKAIISSFILFFALSQLYAQTATSGSGKTVYLELFSNDNPLFLEGLTYKKTFPSPAAREKELMNFLLSSYDNAYLAANYDSIVTDSSVLRAYVTFGPQYKWAYLKNGNIDEGVLSELGYREKLYTNQPIHYKKVKRMQEKLITYYENNGYPFAIVKLDSVTISGNSIAAQLWLTKQSEEKIDSIIIKGTLKIAPVYIYNYLGIKPGSLYNEAQLKKVNTRIAELPFLRSSKPATILFTNKFNKLVLYLEKKQASQFDGIIGILPDNKTGKVLLTGDVRLKLQNGLGKGELIDLNWRRLQTQTQDLKLRFVYPFILRTPFGLDYNFKLYKRDTTFLDVNQNIGLQYMLSGGNYLKLFYANKTSTLLSTKGLEYVTTLPSNADVQTNTYGIGWRYERLDYRLNPRKGLSLSGNAGIGTKSIKKNAKLNPVVYENLKLNSTQYTADLEGSLFIPVLERSTIKAGLQAAFLYNETIFQNELFRIGGLKTLRGFDEESIFTSAFSIITLEYRYLLEQNSYLYIFGDGAYYENNNVQSFVHDTPIGFGAGISFETKAGIFSINYALGKQFDNPVQLKSGKIHFGIVNYF